MTEIAVVTGASDGIGLEVCRQLAQRRMTVILTGPDATAGMRAVASLGEEIGDVRFYPLDVTDQGSVDTLAAALRQSFGRLHVLVNNATVPVPADPPAPAPHPNLLGVWLVTLALLPLLRDARQARIVNVSGIDAGPSTGEAGGAHGAYADVGRPAGNVVARAAMHALTSALARDLAGTEIIVNAVCPTGAAPADAATGIVWAATLPPDGPRGGLFLDRVRQAW